MSFHSTPASVSADWIASAPICMAVLSNRPNGCRPTPMIATSFELLIDFSTLVPDRLESEGDGLGAVLVGGERQHRQLDLLAELQFRRVVLGEAALHADDV